MIRLLFDRGFRCDWLKFTFNNFWYGILGMPSGSGYRGYDGQTHIDL